MPIDTLGVRVQVRERDTVSCLAASDRFAHFPTCCQPERETGSRPLRAQPATTEGSRARVHHVRTASLLPAVVLSCQVSESARSRTRLVTQLRGFGWRLKLYPTHAQAKRFLLWAQSGSELRDLLLARDLEHYVATGNRLTRRELQEVVYDFAAGHPDIGWPAQTRNQHARDHAVAMRNAFRRLRAGRGGSEVGWPVPRRGRPASIYVHNQILKVNGRYMRLAHAGQGWTRYRGTIPDGSILSGRIWRADSGWSLSLAMRAPLPPRVEPERPKCRVTLGHGGLAEVTDGRTTTVYPGVPRRREEKAREARLKRWVERRSWRCTECGGLMRSATRSSLLSRDKRQAPCGHWIVNYERTRRLRRAEAALDRLRRQRRNRRKNSVHNATAAVIRTYGEIVVDAGALRDLAATEFMRQCDYKGEWYGRKVTTEGTAA